MSRQGWRSRKASLQAPLPCSLLWVFLWRDLCREHTAAWSSVIAEAAGHGGGRRLFVLPARGGMESLRFSGHRNPSLQHQGGRGWGKTYFASNGLGLGPCVLFSVLIRVLAVSTSPSGAWLRPTCNGRLHDSTRTRPSVHPPTHPSICCEATRQGPLLASQRPI